MVVQKAEASDFTGRFREIASDPLNMLIPRDPRAGSVESGMVILHNGHRVPLEGEESYYRDFSRILVVNRGVHEPLEEFCFHLLLRDLPADPSMLELGAYWGHYSMWMAQARPNARLHLVEPSPENLIAGQANFKRNGYRAEFFRSFVGKDEFHVDRHLHDHGFERLTLLHADIQGFELEMIEGAQQSLSRGCIDYIFVSTHSQALHVGVWSSLQESGYRIEASSDFEHHTTAHDGFILAVHPQRPRVFPAGVPVMGRSEIAAASPAELLTYLCFLADAVRR